MKKKLIIQLGFPKTGTSYLQKNIFPKLDGVNFIGRWDNTYTKEALGLKEFVTFLLFMPEDAFLNRLSRMEDVLLKINKIHFGETGDREPSLLLSDEALIFRTIDPISIRWHGKFSASIDRLLRRLKIFAEYCGFDLKLILTLRHQSDLIHSLYCERYYIYRKMSDINTFPKYLSTVLNSKFYDYGMSNFQYDFLINKIKSYFNEDSLLILKYEHMKSDPFQFYKKLVDFISCNNNVRELLPDQKTESENKRKIDYNKKVANLGYHQPKIFNNLNLSIVRFLTKIGLIKHNTVAEYRFKNGLWFHKPKIITMTLEQRRLINNTFEKNNKTLSQDYNEFLDYTNG